MELLNGTADRQGANQSEEVTRGSRQRTAARLGGSTEAAAGAAGRSGSATGAQGLAAPGRPGESGNQALHLLRLALRTVEAAVGIAHTAELLEFLAAPG